MTGIESPLMRNTGDWIMCARCFYFEMAPTCSEVTTKVPFCNSRKRQIGWNPRLFYCSDFGTQDDEPVQTSLDWRWS